MKFQLELVWFQFCMQAKEVEQGKRQEVAAQAIEAIKLIFDRLELSLQSSAMRRIIILKLYGGDVDIEEDISKVLQLERSFENIQCAAFFYYWKGMHKEALPLLR